MDGAAQACHNAGGNNDCHAKSELLGVIRRALCVMRISTAYFAQKSFLHPNMFTSTTVSAMQIDFRIYIVSYTFRIIYATLSTSIYHLVV